MADTKYLIKRRELWFFNWRVPSDCKNEFDGKTYVTKSLQTQSLREAQLRRNIALAECSKLVEEVRNSGIDVRSLFRDNLRNMSKVADSDLESAWLATEDRQPKNDNELAFKEALQATYLEHDSELARYTLKDSLKAYKDDRGAKRSPSTVSKAERAVSLLLESFGMEDITLESINRKNVKDFIRSSMLSKKSETVKGWVSMLSACFKVALDDGSINENKSNPFAGHHIEGGDKESYDMFPKQKLKDIFTLTEKWKDHDKYSYRYYLPRLGFTTGCRVEELASLRCDQIKEEAGILYLAIAGEAATYKGKNSNADRKIPIHSSLVEDIKKLKDSSNSALLFESLESKRKDGKHSDKYSKDFGRFKREQLELTERKYSFHSFRSHLSTGFERAKIPENQAVWILGHTRNLSLTYGLYSKGPSLEQLSDDIEKAVVWP